MRPRRSSQARRRTTTRPSGVASSGAVSNVRKHKPDYWILALMIGLIVIGLILVYSISPALAALGGLSTNHYIEKQFVIIALAIVAFVITSRVPLSFWRRYAKPMLIFAGIATIIAIILPVNPSYPAHRWVRLGGFSFQTVELLIFAILMWLADLLAGNISNGKIKQFHATFKPVIITLAAVAIVVVGLQSDLGSAGVILMMVLGMAFVAGVPFKRIAIFGIVILLVGSVAIISSPYRRARVETFMNPEKSCQTTSGYQACQALISVGSGGMIGLGLGRSVQAYGYLPQAVNDSVFAIYAEKFGFIGCALLLLMFGLFFKRLKTVAERAPDDLSRIVVVGVMIWLAVEAIINIGGMIGMLPMKGITLPFVSYGGTSMVFSAAAVGLVFGVSRFTSFSSPRVRSGSKEDLKNNGNSTDRRRIGRTHHTTVGNRS